MRIERISIGRFGPLRDVDIRFALPRAGGAVVVEGPNEAGKSTLLRFVQALLFGGTGVAEGALVLEQDGSRYRVAQQGARGTLSVTELAGGGRADPAVLRRLLGNLDGRVYGNVFAFGLNELQELATLTGEGVQERIFSAAVAGAGRSVHSVQGQLQRELDGLFRPRSASLIRDAARDLREVLATLREAGRALGDHEAMVAEEERLAAEIADRTVRLEALRGDIRTRDLLLQLHERWHRRLEARAALAGAPAVADLPADAPECLGRLRVRAEMLQQQAEQLTGGLEDLRTQAAAPVRGEELLPLGEPVAELAAVLAVQRQRVEEDLPRTGADREEAERLLISSLAALGDGWTEERLAGFRLGKVPTAELEAFAEELAQGRDNRLGADSLCQAATAAVVAARGRVAGLRALGAPEPAPWLAASGEIGALQDEVGAQRSRGERLTAALEEGRRTAADLAEVRARLGPSWDDERIASFAAAAQWRRAAADAQTGAEDLAEQRRRVQAGLEATEVRAQTLREQLLALGVRPARPATAAWGELRLVRERLAALERLAGTLQEQQGARSEVQAAEMARESSPAMRDPRAWIAVAVALAGPLALAAWLWHESPPAAGGLALLAVVLAALIWPRRRTADTAARDPAAEPRQRLAAVERRLREEAGRAGLADAATGAVQEALRRTREAARDLEAEAAAAQRWEEAASALQGAEQTLRATLDRLAAARAQEEEARGAWRAWCVARALPEHLRPEEVPGFLADLERAAGLVRTGRQRQAEADTLARAVRDGQERAQGLALRLGVAGGPAEVAAALREGLERAQQLAVALRELGEAEAREAEAAGRREAIRRDLDGLGNRWAAWCQGHGLPAAPTPEDARRWVAGAQTALTRLEQARTLRGQAEGLRRRAQAWMETAGALLAAAGRPTGGDRLRAVQTLAADIRQAEAAVAARSRARAALGEAEDRLGQIRAQIAAVDEQAAARLREWGLADVAELPTRIEAQRRRAKWLAAVAEAEEELRRRAGRDAPGLAALLDQDEPLVWAAERDERQRECDDLESRLNDPETGLRSRLGGLRADRAALEASAAIPTHRLRAEQLKTALGGHLRRWTVCRLAEGLVGDTLKEYERTHVPEVLRSAGARLAAVTGGRYREVHAHEGGQLSVRSAEDSILDATVLSRGTQEQLYFAVRLGLADSFARQSASLPLLLDDVLVNADPERRAGLIRVLADVTADHQVIVLTCHPDTAQAVLAEVAGAQHIRLGRISPATTLGAPPLSSPDAATHQRLLAVLASEVEGLSGPQLGARLGLEGPALTAVLTPLLDSGAVVRTGRTRGTRYQLAAGGPAEAEAAAGRDTPPP